MAASDEVNGANQCTFAAKATRRHGSHGKRPQVGVGIVIQHDCLPERAILEAGLDEARVHLDVRPETILRADRLHHRERLVEAPRAPEHHRFSEVPSV